MTPTAEFIKRLEGLDQGERSRLRGLGGQPLDRTLQGFDLFTGLWWPLRRGSPAAPRRETSWLVAKLYGAFPIQHFRPDPPTDRPTLARLLGRCEPPHPACPQAALLSSAPPEREPAKGQFLGARRYRRRFDTMLQAHLPALEPHLHWALSVISDAVSRRVFPGLDWALLLDDLSLWDREFNLDHTWQQSRLQAHERITHCHETHRRPQDLWACEYLNATNHQPQGAGHAD